jgi:predicted nucleic acid-binding protein
VTVLDTSAAVDYLTGVGVAEQVTDILASEGEVAAPDVIVFEVLAALRRKTLRGSLSPERAFGALEDLADLSVALFPLSASAPASVGTAGQPHGRRCVVCCVGRAAE